MNHRTLIGPIAVAAAVFFAISIGIESLALAVFGLSLMAIVIGSMLFSMSDIGERREKRPSS